MSRSHISHRKTPPYRRDDNANVSHSRLVASGTTTARAAKGGAELRLAAGREHARALRQAPAASRLGRSPLAARRRRRRRWDVAATRLANRPPPPSSPAPATRPLLFLSVPPRVCACVPLASCLMCEAYARAPYPCSSPARRAAPVFSVSARSMEARQAQAPTALRSRGREVGACDNGLRTSPSTRQCRSRSKRPRAPSTQKQATWNWGWLPDQAGRFCATNRGVAGGVTRERTFAHGGIAAFCQSGNFPGFIPRGEGWDFCSVLCAVNYVSGVSANVFWGGFF